jgi:hypothetical protein
MLQVVQLRCQCAAAVARHLQMQRQQQGERRAEQQPWRQQQAMLRPALLV